MVGLKCGICVIISIISIIEARQSATLSPELKEEEDEPSEAEMLRSGFDNYDLYQYQDFAGLPIQDVFKTILLEHQLPKKYSLADDTLMDYEDSDLLLDSPLLDNPLLDSSLYDSPYDNSYLGSSLLDTNSLIKSPLIKSTMIKNQIVKRPIIKRPMMQTLQSPLLQAPLLQAPLLQAPLLQTPLLQNPYKRKQASLREIETLLKTLLPLFRGTNIPMRARLQIGRQGELTK